MGDSQWVFPVNHDALLQQQRMKRKGCLLYDKQPFFLFEGAVRVYCTFLLFYNIHIYRHID